MSRIDDEIGRRMRTSPPPVQIDELVPSIERRVRRAAIAHSVSRSFLALAVVAITVIGYVALQRAFGSTALTPADTSSPTPPSADQICTTHEVHGHFQDASALDTAILTCNHGDWTLAFDWGSGASGESTTFCRFDCRFWAVADLNGDGNDELVMWSSWADAADGAEWYPLGYLYILDPYPSEGAWAPRQFGGDAPKGLPSVDDMTVFPVGGEESRLAAMSCTADGLRWSVSHQQDDGSWIVHAVRFEFAGDLRLINDTEELDRAEPITQPGMLCGSPILGPADQRPPASGSPVTIPGLDHPVCVVQRLSGDFGTPADEAVLFEEVDEATQDCSAEGFPHLALVRDGVVVATSDRLVGPVQDEPNPWLFATPDIDGDGTDEIAVGIGGSRSEGYARIALYAVSPDGGDAIVPVAFDCGPGCDPVPWINLGMLVDSREGAYCGPIAEGGPQALIRWSTIGTSIEGTAWYLEGDTLVRSDQAFSRPDNGSYPDDGMAHLCGDAVTWPEDLPSTSPTP